MPKLKPANTGTRAMCGSTIWGAPYVGQAFKGSCLPIPEIRDAQDETGQPIPRNPRHRRRLRFSEPG
eukprot:4519849-Lingulodinium_polyedra.AAC.1